MPAEVRGARSLLSAVLCNCLHNTGDCPVVRERRSCRGPGGITVTKDGEKTSRLKTMTSETLAGLRAPIPTDGRHDHSLERLVTGHVPFFRCPLHGSMSGAMDSHTKTRI